MTCSESCDADLESTFAAAAAVVNSAEKSFWDLSWLLHSSF